MRLARRKETAMRRTEKLKAECPMPELLHKLGMGDYAVSNCNSPFRSDTTPSWGIFQWGDNWFFKDHGTDESGDEISLIAQLYELDPETNFRDILEIYENLIWGTQEELP